MSKLFLGVDVGSVSTNIVALDEAGRVMATQYSRNDGQPLEVLQQGMAEFRRQIGRKLRSPGLASPGVVVCWQGRF